MLNAIIIVFKRAAGVVGWVNANALDFASEFLFQCLQRQQVVAKDEAVVKEVMRRLPVRGVVRTLGVFQQNTRLQLRPFLLTHPGQFQFLSHKAFSTTKNTRNAKRKKSSLCSLRSLRPIITPAVSGDGGGGFRRWWPSNGRSDHYAANRRPGPSAPASTPTPASQTGSHPFPTWRRKYH